MSQKSEADNAAKQHDKTYTVDIEGTLYEWHNDTITVSEIANLGGWEAGTGVIEIQTRLAAMGFSPGPADGKYGQRTVSAVRAFQSSAYSRSGALSL